MGPSGAARTQVVPILAPLDLAIWVSFDYTGYFTQHARHADDFFCLVHQASGIHPIIDIWALSKSIYHISSTRNHSYVPNNLHHQYLFNGNDIVYPQNMCRVCRTLFRRSYYMCCSRIHVICLPIFFRIVSLALGYHMMMSSNGVFFALLYLYVGISSVTGEFPSHRESNADFDVSAMWVYISC